MGISKADAVSRKCAQNVKEGYSRDHALFAALVDELIGTGPLIEGYLQSSGIVEEGSPSLEHLKNWLTLAAGLEVPEHLAHHVSWRVSFNRSLPTPLIRLGVAPINPSPVADEYLLSVHSQVLMNRPDVTPLIHEQYIGYLEGSWVTDAQFTQIAHVQASPADSDGLMLLSDRGRLDGTLFYTKSLDRSSEVLNYLNHVTPSLLVY